MVKICDQPYPRNSKYDAHFELFPYELSDFQKYAIEAIVEGHHVLTTAHTGSGKTLSAEFAIRHFTEMGKKVIYTSPIKALSNQKFYEFTRKYPHISFGLMTGDIKTNPNADVLIMTTEILMNYLFTAGGGGGANADDPLSFQIDITTELACVVFDEVHYINDEHRGHVWEQTILTLPPHIQMVMLSATIDAPEKFAQWCETCKTYDDAASGVSPKIVYLASTNHRVVPLTHYGYVASTEALYKTTKNKELEQKWRNATNRIIRLQTDRGEYLETGYKEIAELLDVMETKELRMNRKFVLNNLANYLKTNEMLPAIAFVFSRKHVEMCAREITAVLLEDDSKVPYIVKRECEQIVRKLPNCDEYFRLPEYLELISFLEKGVAIHHSGMIPVLREIVELMISKGYIKMLFATESFAIGLDCPIRTAVFTGLTKYDGRGDRWLMPHEYTQMAGRAGRRGIDTIGHVVHCNNLFRLPSTYEYKSILCGKPQTLVSKFNITYSMVLNLLKRGQTSHFSHFAHKSMIHDEIEKQLAKQTSAVEALKHKYDAKTATLLNMRTPRELAAKYLECETNLPKLVNKKRKETEREMTRIADANKWVKEDAAALKSLNVIAAEWEKERASLENATHYIEDQTALVCGVLGENGFVESDENASGQKYTLTARGILASHMAEIHPLIMGELIEEWRQMADFSVYQIIGLLSCFVDVKVPEDKRALEPKTKDAFLGYRIREVMRKLDKYADVEVERRIYTGIKYDDMLTFDLVDEMMYWGEKCDDEEKSKAFLQNRIAGDISVSVGAFAKACLKISAIAKEWRSVGDKMGYVEWTHKLSLIDGLVLKYVATSQSLYV